MSKICIKDSLANSNALTLDEKYIYDIFTGHIPVPMATEIIQTVHNNIKMANIFKIERNGDIIEDITVCIKFPPINGVWDNKFIFKILKNIKICEVEFSNESLFVNYLMYNYVLNDVRIFNIDFESRKHLSEYGAIVYIPLNISKYIQFGINVVGSGYQYININFNENIKCSSNDLCVEDVLSKMEITLHNAYSYVDSIFRKLLTEAPYIFGACSLYTNIFAISDTIVSIDLPKPDLCEYNSGFVVVINKYDKRIIKNIQLNFNEHIRCKFSIDEYLYVIKPMIHCIHNANQHPNTIFIPMNILNIFDPRRCVDCSQVNAKIELTLSELYIGDIYVSKIILQQYKHSAIGNNYNGTYNDSVLYDSHDMYDIISQNMEKYLNNDSQHKFDNNEVHIEI